MGKATIQEHKGGGQYRIKYIQNIAAIEEAIARKKLEVESARDVEVPAVQALYDAAKAIMEDKKALLNTAIVMESNEEINAATLALNLATIDLGEAQAGLSRAQLKLAELKAALKYLQDHIPQDEYLDAWCADFNAELTGDVGTIEVPGEKKGTPVLVKPGGELGSQAGYVNSDGYITPSMALSPAGNFYNLAMLPGWQKWQPTHRLGTITAIDNDVDTCELVLDEALSSQQSLGINSETVYVDVPVEYMSCNSFAFQVGDRVVAKFERNMQNQSDPLDYRPKVIGFASNPKACQCTHLFTMDAMWNRARRFKLAGGTNLELEIEDNYYTPATIQKVYKNKKYRLTTDPSAPKLEIINSTGDIETHNLPPIDNVYLSGYSTKRYDVKRLEVKNDKIYIHDYKYVIPTGDNQYQNLPSPGAYGRIVKYSLNMVQETATDISLPAEFGDIHVIGVKDNAELYVLGYKAEEVGGVMTPRVGKIYKFNWDWVYQGVKEFTFAVNYGSVFSGEKDRFYIASKITDTVDKAYVYCFDKNWAQLWKTEIPRGVTCLRNNKKYVVVSTDAILIDTIRIAGVIRILDAETGSEKSTYTMPMPTYPGQYIGQGQITTYYSPHRLAVFGETLYVGIKLESVWAGMRHPRVYIFNIANGQFEGKVEGHYNELLYYWYSNQWWPLYYTIMDVKAIAACRKGWWFSPSRSDEYAWYSASFKPPGDMSVSNGPIDEKGGVYGYEAGNFNYIGWGQYFPPFSSKAV